MFRNAVLEKHLIHLGLIRKSNKYYNLKRKHMQGLSLSLMFWIINSFLSPEPNLNMNLRNDIKIILNVQRKSLKNNPYNFWKFVTKKRFNNNISKVMTTSDTITSNLHETANLFSDYFSSVYSTDRIDLESRCQ